MDLQAWLAPPRGCRWFHGLGQELNQCSGALDYDVDPTQVAIEECLDPPGSEMVDGPMWPAFAAEQERIAAEWASTDSDGLE